jgi:hypothetical protein
MARSGKHHQIQVHERIFSALDKLREKENSAEFMPLSMNAFCQKILWDYTQGKLLRLPLKQEGVHLTEKEYQGFQEMAESLRELLQREQQVQRPNRKIA